MSQQESAVVAKNRTVVTVTGSVRRAKENPALIVEDTRKTVVHGPGARVQLEQDEVKTLRKRGFLVDPNAKEIPTGTGPEFRQADGPKVERQQ